MKKNLLLFVLFGIGFTQAQDIHFSQFYVNPMLLNPARTGFFDGNYRLNALYRSQWGSVTVPYQTFSFAGDFGFQNGMYNKNIFGLGLSAYSDKAGDGEFTTTQVSMAASYNKGLDMDNRFYLGYGMMVGYTNSSVDLSKFYFDDQYENPQTADVGIMNSASYFDVSAGLEWNFLATDKMNFSFGSAVFHINEPRHTFMNGDAIIARKYTMNGSATLPASDEISIIPKFYFAHQGAMNEIIYGAVGKFDFYELYGNDMAVYFGAMHRWNDAFLLVGRFDIHRLSVGFSFDINHSSLSHASFGNGGPEISLGYFGSLPSFSREHKKVFCPTF